MMNDKTSDSMMSNVLGTEQTAYAKVVKRSHEITKIFLTIAPASRRLATYVAGG
jgi:hypothetical protein